MACCFWTNNRNVLRLRTSFKKKKKNHCYPTSHTKSCLLNLALNRPEKTSKLMFVNGILHVQPGGPPRLGMRPVVSVTCDPRAWGSGRPLRHAPTVTPGNTEQETKNVLRRTPQNSLSSL